MNTANRYTELNTLYYVRIIIIVRNIQNTHLKNKKFEIYNCSVYTNKLIIILPLP